MKTKLTPAIAALLTLIASARADTFGIDWFTIDGGGGQSSGGGFTVSGTIGQPDAGRLSGGGFTIEGGFWAIIGTVSTPGTPVLRIQLTSPGTVLIAWPVNAGSFTLQQNPVPGTASWSSVTNTVAVVGDENQVVLSTSGSRFYRLVSP